MDKVSKAGGHTPGDWRVSRGAGGDPFSIEASTRTIAAIKTVRDESEANARLIAAAPDLLAALDELLYHRRYPSGFLSQPAITRNAKIEAAASAAIAKATGAEGGGE
jgi:hypothetical protein